jgi:glycosyltransferase involved in cell wall biosynthesis
LTYELASIVLPAYGQASYIDSLVRDYEKALDKLPIPHETIIVLNGPDDGSLEICHRLAAELPTMRILMRESAGWGGAVRLGLDASAGDLLCYTNSARTSVDTLLTLLELAIALPGIVIKANRKTRDSVWRHLGSLVYNLECRSLFDLSNFDINGTPKVFPRSNSQLLDLEREDDLIDLEFLAICRKAGYLVLEAPVVVTKRHGGVSTTNVLSALRMYAGAMLLARRIPVHGKPPVAARLP